MKLTELKCPNCSGKLEAADDKTNKICSFCGSVFLVTPAQPKEEPKPELPVKEAEIPPQEEAEEEYDAPDEPDYEEEHVLMEGACSRVINALHTQSGKGILTDRRFIYLKGNADFDIPLENIDYLSDGRQGLQKTLKIHLNSGEVLQFYVANRSQWKAEMENAINWLD